MTGALLALAIVATQDPTVLELQKEAEALRPLAKTELGRAFIRSAERLKAPTVRLIFRDRPKGMWYSEVEAKALPADQLAKLEKVEAGPSLYYTTKYGTPLAYIRAMDLLGEAGMTSLKGRRVADFGYGGIGQLRLFAGMGAEAIGIDVDPFLPALYSLAEDKGPYANGKVGFVHGQWPADSRVRREVGAGYDLFLSKNTLKNGYLNPARPVDPRMLVQLGVSQDAFLKAVYSALNPGGYLLIYNLSPAPSKPDEPYKPWTDGTSPFSEAQYRAAGFQVIRFNFIDDALARAMGKAIGWNTGPQAMDLENDLFAHVVLCRKP